MSHVGMVAASLAAAAALLAPGVRARAWAMLAALILTPVLLLVDLRDAPQLDPLLDRPALAVGVGAAAALGLGLLAVLFARRPGLFAVLAVAAVPFRIPIEAGGSTANLLVPLYAVVGAGALAWLVPRLWRRGARRTRAAPSDWAWVVADANANADADADVHVDDGPSGSGAHEGDERSPGWLERLLAGAVVLYAVQAAYSSDASKALEQVVFFYVPFLLLFVLLRDQEWTPRLVGRCFAVLVGLALVFVAIGFVEYQQRTLLLNPKVIASNQFESYFRVNSLFFDPNVYGRFLAVVMLGIAAVLLWGRAQRTVLLAVAALAVLWAGLVLTLSQSSFAALLAGLVVLAALRWSPWRSLGVAAALVLVGIGAVLAFPGIVRLDLSSRDSVDRATSGRFDLMDGGIRLAAERPVVGQGSAAFSEEYRKRERASSERAVSASHTIPITVAAEQGVIGFAVYVALLVVALLRLLRGARRSVARAAVAAAFVALVVHTWLYAAFLEDPLSWMLLGVGSALARTPDAVE